jgi:hypothetical protein
MPGTTDVQLLRYGYDTDVLTHTMQANFADDVATKLTALDAQRTKALKRPSVYVQNNSMNIPITTVTTASFNFEGWDTHGLWNIGTPTRLVIPTSAEAGLYWVQARVSSTFGGTPWTQGEITIRKNGGNTLRTKYIGNPYRMNVEGIVWLGAAADYVDMAVYHEGGGSSSCDVSLRAQKICEN